MRYDSSCCSESLEPVVSSHCKQQTWRSGVWRCTESLYSNVKAVGHLMLYLDDEDNKVRTEQVMQCIHFHTAQHRLFSGFLTLSGVIRCLFLHAVTHELKLNPQSPSFRVDSLPLDRWAGLFMCFKLRLCALNWDWLIYVLQIEKGLFD